MTLQMSYVKCAMLQKKFKFSHTFKNHRDDEI